MIAIAGRRRLSSSTRFSFSFLIDNNNDNVHGKDDEFDEFDDDGKNRRWISSSSSSSLTSSSTSSKSGGRRGMSSDASPSSSSSSSDSSNSNSKSSSTRNEREKDDDDDATKKEKKTDGVEGAKSTTSAKAQDLLNAFRKQREKLQSDPRVKEAFSEAKKFKEEMKREVGMERMFGKGGGATSASGASEEKEASPESSSSDSSSSNSASSASSSSEKSKKTSSASASTSCGGPWRRWARSTWTKPNSLKKNGKNSAKRKCEITPPPPLGEETATRLPRPRYKSSSRKTQLDSSACLKT